MSNPKFYAPPKLMWRLLKYFVFVIIILFAFIIYYLKYTETYTIKTSTHIQTIKELQDIDNISKNMTGNVKNYYLNCNSKYINNFKTGHKEARDILNKLRESDKNNYIYRDLDAYFETFQSSGSNILNGISKNFNAKIYYMEPIIKLENLQRYIHEESYIGIDEKLSVIKNLSDYSFSTTVKNFHLAYFLVFIVTLLGLFFAYRFSVEIEQNAIVENSLKEEQLRNIEMKNLLNESELKYLQMQINPHFLFNTFNSVSALSLMENAPKTKSVIDSLSYLLRYSISNISKMVTLRDEKQIIENYLFIQKVRFDKRLDYDVNIPKEYLDYKIPSMILQPIVENSIIHGIEPKEFGGKIQISIQDFEDRFYLIIYDNGTGINEENINGILENESDSIGLYNVKRRLEMIYGGQVIEISSVPHLYTEVRVCIFKEVVTK